MNTKLISEILLFSLLPFLSINSGGILGTFFKIKDSIRSFMLHLAAGVIFAVVAIDLLPKVVLGQNLFIVSTGFFGIAAYDAYQVHYQAI
jgi:zinc transporter, ZIP family